MTPTNPGRAASGHLHAPSDPKRYADRRFSRLARVALCTVVVSITSAGSIASAGTTAFTHPRLLGEDYCFDSFTAARNVGGTYITQSCEGGCQSFLDPDFLIGAVVCNVGFCEDGIQNGLEEGVDCGAVCPAECNDCLDQLSFGSNPAVPTEWSEQTGSRLLQVFDDELRLRAFDTLYEYADDQGVEVTSLDSSDDYLAAVAYYVDARMDYKCDTCGDPDEEDNQECINDRLNLAYDPGWDFPIPANYTIAYTGHPDCDCSTLYCGDCEDHSILRQALSFVLGVDDECIWDALGWNWVVGEWVGHEYNLMLYQSKFRIMDYGPIETYLVVGGAADPMAVMHVTMQGWNKGLGIRGQDSSNLPSVHTHNYFGNPICPLPWNFTTYYLGTCP